MTTMQTAMSAAPRTYKRHAALMSKLDPNIAGWRGCTGIALLLDGEVQAPEGGRTGLGFVRNDQLTWLTAIDIPVPWMTGLAHAAHMMQFRRAALRYGSPMLDQSSLIREFDYWDGPKSELELPVDWIAAADGVNNAMTSTAFVFRSVWKKHADVYEEYTGVKGEPQVIIGDHNHNPVVVKDYRWVPRPWVGVDPRNAATLYKRLREGTYTDAFRRVVVDLFAAGMPISSPVDGYFTGVSPLDQNGMRYTQFNFRERNGAKHAVVATAAATVSSARGMPVARGTEVGKDGPPVGRAFYHMPLLKQWNEVVRAYAPEVLDLVLGNAFSALFKQIGKSWLLPYAVLGQDISYSFGTGELWWDVSTLCDRNFDLSGQGRIFICPTMRMVSWDAFRDHLGMVALDLTPTDPRFRSYALGRQIRRPLSPTVDGRTGVAESEIVPVAFNPAEPAGRLPDLPDVELDRAIDGNR